MMMSQFAASLVNICLKMSLQKPYSKRLDQRDIRASPKKIKNIHA